MSQERWTAVDDYLSEHLVGPDAVLEAALAGAAAGVTATAVQTVGSKGYDGFAIALVEGDAGWG